MDPIFSIATRSVIVYVFIIIAIRVFGKKELAQLSVIDLVFILLISNSVQNAMVGENTSLVGGLIAATALFIANVLLKNLFFRSKRISEFFQGDPLFLIYNGKINEEHLRAAKISHAELEATVREHGIEDISTVDLAVLEVDGNISILSENFHQRSMRRRKIHKALMKNS